MLINLNRMHLAISYLCLTVLILIALYRFVSEYVEICRNITQTKEVWDTSGLLYAAS